jgi:cytochrome c-type biogenesis protein CcmH
MKARLRLGLVALAAVMLVGAAPDPAERLRDPAQEARARHLMQAFRCVVCQNESIDDSEADLAGDLRLIIRQQVSAGRSDADIQAFMQARYGEFILLKPPFNLGNAALWLTPLLVLLIGAGSILLLRRRQGAPEPALTSQEEARLAALRNESAHDTLPPHIRPPNTERLTET